MFVIDRSGSMSGPKIAQVKSALTYLLRQLDAADTFNIVAYDSEVESFRPELQRGNAASVPMECCARCCPEYQTDLVK